MGSIPTSRPIPSASLSCCVQLDRLRRGLSVSAGPAHVVVARELGLSKTDQVLFSVIQDQPRSGHRRAAASRITHRRRCRSRRRARSAVVRYAARDGRRPPRPRTRRRLTPAVAASPASRRRRRRRTACHRRGRRPVGSPCARPASSPAATAATGPPPAAAPADDAVGRRRSGPTTTIRSYSGHGGQHGRGVRPSRPIVLRPRRAAPRRRPARPRHTMSSRGSSMRRSSHRIPGLATADSRSHLDLPRHRPPARYGGNPSGSGEARWGEIGQQGHGRCRRGYDAGTLSMPSHPSSSRPRRRGQPESIAPLSARRAAKGGADRALEASIRLRQSRLAWPQARRSRTLWGNRGRARRRSARWWWRGCSSAATTQPPVQHPGCLRPGRRPGFTNARDYLYDSFGYCESDWSPPATEVRSPSDQRADPRADDLTALPSSLAAGRQRRGGARAAGSLVRGPQKRTTGDPARARAIENTCYVIAAGQTDRRTSAADGRRPDGVRFGNIGAETGTRWRTSAERLAEVRRRTSLENRR